MPSTAKTGRAIAIESRSCVSPRSRMPSRVENQLGRGSVVGRVRIGRERTWPAGTAGSVPREADAIQGDGLPCGHGWARPTAGHPDARRAVRPATIPRRYQRPVVVRSRADLRGSVQLRELEHLALGVREDRRIARGDDLRRASPSGRPLGSRTTYGYAVERGSPAGRSRPNRRPPTVWWLTSGSRLTNVSLTPSKTPSGVGDPLLEALRDVEDRRVVAKAAGVDLGAHGIEDLLSRRVDDACASPGSRPRSHCRRNWRSIANVSDQRCSPRW